MENTVKRQRILIIILAVALAVCFFSVNSLKTELDNSRNNFNSQIQNLRNEIDSIYSDVDEMLKEKASLLTSFDYSYGELDAKNMKVPVSVKITPKTVNEDTSLTLSFGNKSIAMVKGEGTEFTADFLSDLFLGDEEGNVRLIIKNGSMEETEELDWYISSLHGAFLPYLYSHFVFDHTSFDAEKGLTVDGDVMYLSDEEEIKNVKNIKLIYKLNDKTVETQEILPEEGRKFDSIDINKAFPEAKEGDTFELFQEYEDNYGFIHRSTVTKYTCKLPNEEGSVETEEVVSKDGEIILDKEGNVLYQ